MNLLIFFLITGIMFCTIPVIYHKNFAKLYPAPIFIIIFKTLLKYFKQIKLPMLIYGLFFAAIFTLLYYFKLTSEIRLFFLIIFIWFMILTHHLDAKYQLIPDFLTYPLLILGILFSLITYNINIYESITGAIIGYFLTALVNQIAYIYNKNSIGGGDIKIFGAIGAWVGINYLGYFIILTTIFAAIFSLISKKRLVPIGTSCALSGILVICYMIFLN